MKKEPFVGTGSVGRFYVSLAGGLMINISDKKQVGRIQSHIEPLGLMLKEISCRSFYSLVPISKGDEQ